MKRRVALAVSLTFALGIARLGLAENLITFEMIGVVTSVEGASSGVVVGDPFVIRLTYDLDTPDSLPDDPMIGGYVYDSPVAAPLGFAGTVGDLAVNSDQAEEFEVGIGDNSPEGDMLLAAARFPSPAGKMYIYVMLGEYLTQTVFTDDSLPTALNIADWDVAWFGLRWGDNDVRGDILDIRAVGAQVLLQQLVLEVQDSEIADGVAQSLTKKLDNALAALEAENGEQRADAVHKLAAFIQAVEAQSGKKIDPELAEMLIAAAEDAILSIVAEP